MTDLFGRTTEEVRQDIEWGQKRLLVSEAWRGNEGLALDLARARATVEVDRRQLAMLERGIDPKDPRSWPDSLSGKRLDEWRHIFTTGRRR